jgi:hypothetical protein
MKRWLLRQDAISLLFVAIAVMLLIAFALTLFEWLTPSCAPTLIDPVALWITARYRQADGSEYNDDAGGQK